MQKLDARRVFGHNSERQGGLKSAGTSLERIMPEPVVSKQKLRQAEGISLVRSKREEGSQVLAFSARPFVMCGLPVGKPPAGQLLFERRTGSFLVSDHRSSRVRATLWSGPTCADLLGNACRPAKESDSSLPLWVGNAGDVRNEQGWEGVSPTDPSFRTNLRCDDLLWFRSSERNRQGSPILTRWHRSDFSSMLNE